MSLSITTLVWKENILPYTAFEQAGLRNMLHIYIYIYIVLHNGKQFYSIKKEKLCQCLISSEVQV